MSQRAGRRYIRCLPRILIYVLDHMQWTPDILRLLISWRYVEWTKARLVWLRPLQVTLVKTATKADGVDVKASDKAGAGADCADYGFGENDGRVQGQGLRSKAANDEAKAWAVVVDLGMELGLQGGIFLCNGVGEGAMFCVHGGATLCSRRFD